jgi:tRNA threonylcarbamoyladenosine biosynthesis protein TsaB
VHQAFEHAPQRHAELVLDMAEEVLAAGGVGVESLDGLALGRGPGSFTGVRIAAAVVQGIAGARDLPVARVSTLQALAQGALRQGQHRRVLAALDARMGEVYWGAFAAAGDAPMTPAGDEAVCPPERAPLPEGSGWVAVGPGWSAHREALLGHAGTRVQVLLPQILPEAQDVALLGALELAAGHGVPAAAALPVYLRDRVVR